MPARTYTITFGGWYQRTTLHLTEIYDFLAYGSSRLDLSKEKLAEFQTELNLQKVTREVGKLEYVKAVTQAGIEIRYYEDGLYVLNAKSDDVDTTQRYLDTYFGEIFEPAISYIFSLGAPTPKILANIRIHHPTVVSLVSKNHSNFEVNEKYGGVYSQVSTKDATVYKTPQYIFAVSGKKSVLRSLVETQIFFREYKDQLEKYLNIHRIVWEDIANIKERGEITGGEVGKIRSKLDRYQKTIDLINNRINQMGAYINTRRSIAKSAKVEDELVTLFQYKFETLSDTHAYIRELWKMTLNYLNSAIKVVGEIEAQSTNISIQSLRTVTMIGVLSGILGYLAIDEVPKLSGFGAIYFVILIAATWSINKIIQRYYKGRRYTIKITERSKNI